MEFHIATEIIKLRTKFGLTQRQLAEKTGIKQPQIARIEAGKQKVKLETLERIAESLGYSVEVRLVPKIEEKSDREGIQDWDGGESRYQAYLKEFSSDSYEEEDEEVVTNDDENCWIEYSQE